MKYLSTFIALSVCVECRADAFLNGVNDAGEHVRAVEVYFDYGPNGVSWGPNFHYAIEIERKGKVLRTYEKELCGFNELTTIWSCAKTGSSPLAGAAYRLVKELPNCKGTLLVCKEGCGRGAPREMIPEPSECEEAK